MTGVFAGYEISSGYRWGGHYYVWDLRDFREADLGKDAPASNYRHMTKHQVKVVVFDDGDVRFPLKAEYERVNHTLGGIRDRKDPNPPGYVPTPMAEDHEGPNLKTPRDFWQRAGGNWMRVHVEPRTRLYSPNADDGGPPLADISWQRCTLMNLEDGVTRFI